MLPTEIQNIFDEYTDWDYWLVVKKVTWVSDLVLVFNISVQDIDGKGEISQDWAVQAKEPLSSRISFDWFRHLSMSENHPLLWNFTDIRSELYVSGKVTNAPAIFYELHKIHRSLYGGMVDFEMPSFDSKFLSESDDFSSGLVTTGPKQLMEMYSECFQNAGMECQIVESPNLSTAEETNLSVSAKILVLGNSFVIAQDFEFRKAVVGDI